MFLHEGQRDKSHREELNAGTGAPLGAWLSPSVERLVSARVFSVMWPSWPFALDRQ